MQAEMLALSSEFVQMQVMFVREHVDSSVNCEMQLNYFMLTY